MKPRGAYSGPLNAKLLGVLSVQSLPSAELHRVGADDASDGVAGEKPIQHVQADVPPGSAHCDEAAIDVGPQRQTRAAPKGFELPSHVETTPLVLEQLRSIRSSDSCFGNKQRGRSNRGELHRGSSLTQTRIGVKRSPLAKMRWVSQRLPDLFWGVAQLSNENELPRVAVSLYLRPARGTGRVEVAIDH